MPDHRTPTACPRRDALFGHCSFQPRYEAMPPSWPRDFAFWSTPGQFQEMQVKQPRYLGDICTRCGDWRKPPGGTP